MSLALEVKDREDVSIDLSTPEALSKLKNQTITIKEGADYRLKVVFKVQHDVVSGLKYLHVVKRSGLKVDKMQEMVGSYGPSPDLYTKKVNFFNLVSSRGGSSWYVSKGGLQS